jgi:hypothetical protein
LYALASNRSGIGVPCASYGCAQSLSRGRRGAKGGLD